MNIRHFIDLVENLNEGARALLYHGTSFSGAYQILQSGKLEASDKRMDDEQYGGYHNISLTRDPTLRYYDSEGQDFTGTAPVVFVIDQDILRQKTKTKPFEFHGTGARGAEEAEEQAITTEIDIDHCVVAIRLYTPPKGFPITMDDLYQLGIDPDSDSESKIKRKMPSMMNSAYEQIAEMAHSHGIEVQDLRKKSPKHVMRRHVEDNIKSMKS